MTTSGGQACLRRAVIGATEPAPDRESQLTREIVGLVEAATQTTPWMERNGHDGVRAGEDVCARVAQPGAERDGEGPPALILERLQDLAERAVVAAEAARERE